MTQDESAVARGSGVDSLRAWWLRRMIQTPHPLKEKMTLFWHGHFGVSNARVNDGRLMIQHVQRLRENALGSYRTLLEGSTLDPALFSGAGVTRSRKSQPDENFARHLLDRLSVGPEHHNEQDVRQASLAFSGWSMIGNQLRFFEYDHDPDRKTVLGQEGKWGPEDVVRIVLDQQATRRLVARKLYRWLVSEVDEPSDALIDPLAEMLTPRYDIGQVVETVLRSNLFFSELAYRRRVKSPVEYALGIVTGMEEMVPTLPLGAALAQLGQNLYSPPTAGGWVGGRHWINAITVLGRENLADDLLAPEGPLGGKLDPASVVQKHASANSSDGDNFLVRLFLQDDVSPETRSAMLTARSSQEAASGELLRAGTYRVVTLPEFHLC